MTTKKKTPRKYEVKPAKRMFNIRTKINNADLTQAEKSKMYAFIERESGYKKDAISKLMYMRTDSQTRPNLYILNAFAKYFNCTVEDLKNIDNSKK